MSRLSRHRRLVKQRVNQLLREVLTGTLLFPSNWNIRIAFQMNNEFNILYKVFHFNQRSGILSIQNIDQNQKLIIIFFPK